MGISNDKVEKRKWRLAKLLSLRQGTLLFMVDFQSDVSLTPRDVISVVDQLSNDDLLGIKYTAKLRSRAKSLDFLCKRRNKAWRGTQP